MNKKDLNKLGKSDLIDLIISLSKLNKENKLFLETKLSFDFNDLFVLSCKKIDKAFSCFGVMSLKDARKTLIDFRKAKPSDSLFVDLCLYYIKCVYELEKTDWRFQENFYTAIEKTFDMVFEILKKDVLLKEKYCVIIEEIINQSNEGWGHQNYLKDRFESVKKEK
jgi:hypothetical protein